MNLDRAFDFTGKTAVVIGGSGVLCSALAQALGRAGASVVVVGHSRVEVAQAVADQILATGGQAIATQADVLDRTSLEAMGRHAVETFGHVDILINGAGGAKKEATTSEELSFFELPEEAVRWVFDLNFMGTFLACQVFGRHMVEGDSGSILTISSAGADRPLTRSVAYSAAKAAVVNFTKWLAIHMSQEYTPHIRVNAIMPGFFLTEQNRFLLVDEATGELTERGRRIIAHTPMGRFGKPEDLIGPALLLLSDVAGFVHGTTPRSTAAYLFTEVYDGMADLTFTATLIDYDEDLFAPPDWVGDELAGHGIEWVVGQHRSPEAALDAARASDVVLQQSIIPLLTQDVIARLERPRCIVRLGTGYDNVDVAAATSKGILLCNTPTYCVDDVADHALALLMDGVRHVARQDRWIRAGRWDRTGARPARRMKGCTMGFVAFGQIARALAQRVSGFGMTLLAYDPYLDADTIARHGAHKVELDELLGRADFISVHCPLTDETHHLLSAREFSLMKGGVFIVNTSRGPIIDEAALIDALRSGALWGAGLDVFEHEPLPLDSPLREFDNVTFTPHVGASTMDSLDDVYRIGGQIAVDVRYGRWPPWVVNPEAEAEASHTYRRE